MINNIVLKGIITYKKKLPNMGEDKQIEFGLSYNTKGNRVKIHQIICVSNGKTAEFIEEYLYVKDIILVLGYLTSKDNDCKEVQILNVKNFEPIKTSRNIVFTDSSVNESIFNKYIAGFDYHKKNKE